MGYTRRKRKSSYRKKKGSCRCRYCKKKSCSKKRGIRKRGRKGGGKRKSLRGGNILNLGRDAFNYANNNNYKILDMYKGTQSNITPATFGARGRT